MKEGPINPYDKLYLLYNTKREILGCIDYIEGQSEPDRYNYGFSSLEKLQIFINTLGRLGYTNETQFMIFPTTFREYYDEIKPRVGDLDLAMDTPPETMELDIMIDKFQIN
jgi:hypothetical protein